MAITAAREDLKVGATNWLPLVATALALIPFWSTSIFPSTDLPQHLGQIQLLEQTLSGIRPELTVTPWFYPNTLIYWILYLFWQISDPISAGKLTLSTLAALWVGSTWFLCRWRQRPIENWLIATPLVFNFLFSWGLLNFLVGWPVFCVFLALVSGPKVRYQSALILLTALLLYYAHALWFAMANLWLAAHALEHDWHERIRRALPTLPVWMLALIWYPQLVASRQGSGVETGLGWGAMPISRLNLDYVTNSALGSIHSDIEVAYTLFVLAWIGASIITHRRELETRADKSVLLAATLLLLAYFAFPSAYMNTIFFNQRWLPCALALLLLSLPAPRLRTLYTNTIGIGCMVLFASVTIAHARDWETEHLDGFFDTISRTSPNEKLLSLNLMDGSFYIKGRPGLQLFAYAQIMRGTHLHFDFTEHYSGIVQYRNPPLPNPARQLVWAPGLAKPEHLTGFDKILINGNESLHEMATKKLNITPISENNKPWRLYQPR